MTDTQRGFNIGVFKAELNNKKLLKPNLFIVEFSIPNVLIGTTNYRDNLQTVKTLEYWCEATTLPGMMVQTYQGQRYGYGTTEQRPLMNVYGEIQIDVLMDAETLNYDFFFDWMNSIINTKMIDGPNEENTELNVNSFGSKIKSVPYELTYKEDYSASIGIMIYDQTGFLTKKLILRDAFPKSIGDIRLAWSDNNSFMRLPIQFAYTDWHHEQINGD